MKGTAGEIAVEMWDEWRQHDRFHCNKWRVQTWCDQQMEEDTDIILKLVLLT